VLFDVTQYASFPATTGVQRTLFNIAKRWTGRHLTARYGVLNNSAFETGPIELLAYVLNEAFAGSHACRPPEPAKELLVHGADETVALSDLANRFDGYFLPEPTVVDGHLDLVERLAAGGDPASFFLFYDALSLTHPQHFPASGESELTITAYTRALSRARNIAFISEHSREMFEQRIAQRPSPAAIVLHLGADGMAAQAARPSSATSRFTVLGTIEPRKRHRLVLEAFERLWATGSDYELVLVGTRGCESPDIFARLEAHERLGRLWWHERASDRMVAEMIATSTAVIFVPEAEGYGLPAVEALAAGCPVIVSDDIPSLEALPPLGQLRLGHVDAATIAAAVKNAADPRVNLQLRTDLTELSLPRWEDCVGQLERWIEAGLGGVSSTS
jgi:glycosyltransferase involved in cell wall biosynthesis